MVRVRQLMMNNCHCEPYKREGISRKSTDFQGILALSTYRNEGNNAAINKGLFVDCLGFANSITPDRGESVCCGLDRKSRFNT